MSGTGKFDPDNDRLRKSLAWHVRTTLEVQTRLVKALKYVRAHSGDPQLLAILDGNRGAEEAFRGIDTASIFDANQTCVAPHECRPDSSCDCEQNV